MLALTIHAKVKIKRCDPRIYVEWISILSSLLLRKYEDRIVLQ